MERERGEGNERREKGKQEKSKGGARDQEGKRAKRGQPASFIVGQAYLAIAR